MLHQFEHGKAALDNATANLISNDSDSSQSEDTEDDMRAYHVQNKSARPPASGYRISYFIMGSQGDPTFECCASMCQVCCDCRDEFGESTKQGGQAVTKENYESEVTNLCNGLTEKTKNVQIKEFEVSIIDSSGAVTNFPTLQALQTFVSTKLSNDSATTQGAAQRTTMTR